MIFCYMQVYHTSLPVVERFCKMYHKIIASEFMIACKKYRHDKLL
jgi:hypothetical protein